MKRKETPVSRVRKVGGSRHTRVSSMMERVREQPSIQEIQLVYMETGWLTPTILLVMLGKLAEKLSQKDRNRGAMKRDKRKKRRA